VQTGFSQEALMRQMGIEAPRVNKETHRWEKSTPKRYSQQSDIPMPEKTLIALLASGKTPEGAVHVDDFDHPLLKMLCEKLLANKTTAAILAEYEDDALRQQISEIFVLNADIRDDNASMMTEECLNKIRISRLQKQIDDLNEKLSALADEEKAAALKELMTLSAELTRLKRAVH